MQFAYCIRAIPGQGNAASKLISIGDQSGRSIGQGFLGLFLPSPVVSPTDGRLWVRGEMYRYPPMDGPLSPRSCRQRCSVVTCGVGRRTWNDHL